MSLADTHMQTEYALERVIRRLEEAWCPPPVPEVDAYGYRPLPLPVLLAGIDALREQSIDPGAQFVDLGCGLGRTLLCMWAFGYSKLRGVEIMPQFAAIASGLVPVADIQIGDADTADVSDAQVIYSYRPFKDTGLAEVYTKNLIDRTKRGQLLWVPQVQPAGLCEHVGGYVYRRT